MRDKVEETRTSNQTLTAEKVLKTDVLPLLMHEMQTKTFKSNFKSMFLHRVWVKYASTASLGKDCGLPCHRPYDRRLFSLRKLPQLGRL